jgi:HEAT repeat protein
MGGTGSISECWTPGEPVCYECAKEITMRNLILATLILGLAACSKQEESAPAAPSPAPATPPQKVEPAKPSTPAVAPAPSKAPFNAQASLESSENPAQAAAALENAYTSNQDFTARVETIYKLSDAGTPQALAALGRLFHMEKDPDLKTEILDSLFDIDGQDEGKAALLAAGAGSDQPKDVRQSAIDGLEDVKPEIAMPILKTLTSDPDPDISEAAKDALESLQLQQANP